MEYVHGKYGPKMTEFKTSYKDYNLLALEGSGCDGRVLIIEGLIAEAGFKCRKNSEGTDITLLSSKIPAPLRGDLKKYFSANDYWSDVIIMP